MNLKEIKSSIENLENLSIKLGFNFEIISDICRLIKDDIEILLCFDEETLKKNFKNNIFLVVSDEHNYDNVSYKTISINDIEKLLDLKTILLNDSLFYDIVKLILGKFSFEKGLNIINILKEQGNKEQELENISETKPIKSTDEGKRNEVIESLSKYFEKDITKYKKGYCGYGKQIGIVHMESKNYYAPSYNYWYSYHSYQIKFLDEHNEGYIVLTFKDVNGYLLIPNSFINKKLDQLGSSPNNGDKYWHFHIKRDAETFWLRIPNQGVLNISDFYHYFGDKKQANENKYDGGIVIGRSSSFVSLKQR